MLYSISSTFSSYSDQSADGGVSLSNGSSATSKTFLIITNMVCLLIHHDLQNQIDHVLSSGDSERTMLLSFIKGSKFRQWAARPDCPPALKACKTLLDDLLDGGRDTTPNSEVFTRQPTPEPLKTLLGGPELKMTSYIQHNGTGLRADSSNTPGKIGNSLVMVRPDSSSEKWSPAQISYIYLHANEIKVAVRFLQPLSNTAGYPQLQRQFEDFPADLYDSRFANELHEIPLDRVGAHYALWRLSGGLSLILNLDKVSLHRILEESKTNYFVGMNSLLRARHDRTIRRDGLSCRSTLTFLCMRWIGRSET